MANWQGATAGTLGGAAAGAPLGPWGAAAGAGIGFLGGLFTGEEGKTKKGYNPQQQALYDTYLQQAQDNASGKGFGNIENYARQQFQSSTVPSLAERFTSMGGSGTSGSSDFGATLGGAGADLESQLAALRHQYGLENQRAGLELLQQGGEYYQPRDPGIGAPLLQAGLSTMGNYAAGGGFSNMGGQQSGGNISIPKQQLQQLLQYLQKQKGM